MDFEVAQRIGAGRHERSEARTARRNGHRERTLDTRLGTLGLAIPKLRTGSFSPRSWSLEPRRLSERALTAVIQQAWVGGVSTRKMGDLVKAIAGPLSQGRCLAGRGRCAGACGVPRGPPRQAALHQPAGRLNRVSQSLNGWQNEPFHFA